MTDPKRWIEDGAPEDVRHLLVAGSAERPREGAPERMLGALGAASVLGAARASGAAPIAKSSLATKGVLAAGQATLAAKWGFLGVIAALATAGTVEVVRERTHSSPVVGGATAGEHERSIHATAPAPSTAVSPQEPAPEQPTSLAPSGPSVDDARAASPPVKGLRAPAHVAGTPGGNAAREEPSELSAEVAAIDAARAAVQRGDTSSALATLNAYAQRFDVRHFEPEALYLRMEALAHAGDVDGQRRVAEQLLARFPAAPQAARARAVLDARR